MKLTEFWTLKKMEQDSTLLSKSQKPCGQPETLADHYQSTLDHLILMASQNGWKAHAWHRAKELESHYLGIYNGISQELTKKMKEINDLHRD
jgi:hypothetical protein